MSQITNFSFPFPESRWKVLKEFLINLGVEIIKTPYGFKANHADSTINWFNSGKLLIQGNDAQDMVEELYLMGLIKTGWRPVSEPRIGIDESGKGDYFGPLIIASALITKEQEPQLIKLGVRDSKTISDSSVKQISQKLEKIIPHSKIIISPKKYNELHLKLKNVNLILAWAHARAIENLLEKHPANLAISDQFGDQNYLLNALLEKGKKIKLVQRHHAEEDLAVASASIIARAEFLSRLEKLSKEFGIKFPKGISEQTIIAGKMLVDKMGPKILEETAKIHFKTTNKILS